MYILSIYEGHNATAALLKDGKIVGCVSEERFNGKKNYIGFPHKSIKYLLKENNIQRKDMDFVVLTDKWGVPVFAHPKVSTDFFLKIVVICYKPFSFLRNLLGKLEYRYYFLHLLYRFIYESVYKIIGNRTTQKQKEFLSSYFGIRKDQIKCYDHHSCHAAAAYYGSSYNNKDALVLTIDGEGDLLSSSVNVVKNNTWIRLAETSSDHSLGFIYAEVTEYLGMKKNEHEYKVMGLAPYAKEYGMLPLYEKIKEICVLDKKNPLKFYTKFNTHYTNEYLEKNLMNQRFDYIAGAFQKLVEDRLVEWVKEAIKKTGITTVCLGGGVIMNVKANLKISELPEVKELFPCPSAGDESLPIGGCYLGYIDYCKNNNLISHPHPFKTLYLGSSFTNDKIKQFLLNKKYFRKYKIEYIKNIEKKIAVLLSKDKIVARLAGKMEWGARALGNRSIMANPSNGDLIRVINEKMKMRDFWMPFASSILKERANDYIINPKNIPAPYMIMTFDTTELAKKHLRAAMHPYDFTCRPQVIEKKWNPSYYKIIKEFEKLTGIGGILNTSFNLHGSPIVLGPKEAMYALENSGLEYLVLENYFITKK